MSGRFRPRPRVADFVRWRRRRWCGPRQPRAVLSRARQPRHVGGAHDVRGRQIRPASVASSCGTVPAATRIYVRAGTRRLAVSGQRGGRGSTAGTVAIVVILNWAGPEEVVLPDHLHQRHTLARQAEAQCQLAVGHGHALRCVSIWSSPAFSSVARWAAVGVCGEPIAFQTVYALL